MTVDTCIAAANCTTRKVGKEMKVSPGDRLVDGGFEIIVTEEHKLWLAHRHTDGTETRRYALKGTATHRQTVTIRRLTVTH